MKRLILGVGAVSVLAGAGYAFWLYQRLEAFSSSPFGTPGLKVEVEIKPGTTLKALGKQLAEAGVASDESLFYWYGREQKADKALKTGEYEFDLPVTPEAVLKKVLSGQVRLYHFTVPEGLRMDEIFPIIEKSSLASSSELDKLARDPTFAKGLGVPAKNLEGYLYPDTYSFPKGVKPQTLLSKMVARFKEEYAAADKLRKPGVTLDELQTAILASIVEKETGKSTDRAHVSCVFHNRLKKHMRLETDPTVIYAVVLAEGKFNGNLTKANMLMKHPYNTYTVAGLPPGPIANAGRESIRAALMPLDCPDLFFVATSDGNTAFCPTFGCHDKNVQKFQLAPQSRAKSKKKSKAHKRR